MEQPEMVWSSNYRKNGSDVVSHTFEWISNGSGVAILASGQPISGRIERVVFVPSVTAAPTAAYDVTLNDEYGIDVLSGQGTDLASSGNTSICPGIPIKDGTTVGTVPIVVDGTLTLNVANAGASKSGKVVVYVR